MEKVLFLLMAGGRDEKLKPLTDYRPKSLIRFGPEGVLLDFPLHNCISSDAGDAVILSDYLSDMVDAYVRRGWRFAFESSNHHLMVLQGKRSPKGKFEGNADALHYALSVMSNPPETIVVLSADNIYRMDYRQIIKFHRSSNAPVTVGVASCDPAEANRHSIVSVRNDGGITRFQNKPKSFDDQAEGGKKPLASMGVYVFQRETLMKYLENNQDDKSRDLAADIMPTMVESEEARAFIFAKKDGRSEYWRDIMDIPTYWSTHMDLLNGQFKDLLLPPIRTLCQLPFSVNNFVRRAQIGERRIMNSLVSETARIGTAQIEDSVIGPDVIIEDGATIKNSVVLDSAHIRKWSRLDGVVVEPLAEVRPGLLSLPLLQLYKAGNVKSIGSKTQSPANQALLPGVLPARPRSAAMVEAALNYPVQKGA